MALHLYALRNVLSNNCKNRLNNHNQKTVSQNFSLKLCTDLYATKNLKKHKLYFRTASISNSNSSSSINSIQRLDISNISINFTSNEFIIMSQKRFFHDANFFNYSMQEQSFECLTPTSPNGTNMPVKKYYRKAAHSK
ncbi:hypothetical protein DOY81_012057, partial [Sarcophaga bullata]